MDTFESVVSSGDGFAAAGKASRSSYISTDFNEDTWNDGDEAIIVKFGR